MSTTTNKETATMNDDLTKRFGGDGSLVGFTYKGVDLMLVSQRSVVYRCQGGFSFAQTTRPMNVKRTLVDIDRHLASGMTVVDGDVIRVRQTTTSTANQHQQGAN